MVTRIEYSNVFFKTMSNAIASYDVISFDIFDTILFRKFLSPNDVWNYIEKKYNAIGFANNRAECNRGSTIDDIVQYMKMFMHNLTSEDRNNLKHITHDSLLQNDHCDPIIFT